jgi:hypothetical protein
MKKLVNIFQLSEALGPPVRTFRTLMHAKKIPYFKTGHRSVLFDVAKVEAAISKFEIKSVTAK